MVDILDWAALKILLLPGLIAAMVSAALVAGIAQLAEQLICNQQVVGSIPTAGSLYNLPFEPGGRSVSAVKRRGRNKMAN
jgi:hypothetical protein